MRAEGHTVAGGGSYSMSTGNMIVYALFIVGLIVVVYLVLKDAAAGVVTTVKETVTSVNPMAAISQAQQTATSAIVAGANSAQNNGHVLTGEDYNKMLAGVGWPVETVVRAGNVITPPVVLEAAARAGSESAETVNRLGLNDAYVDLSLPAKGLVTLGQGIGKAVGVDLIQMGYDMRSDITASTQRTNDASALWVW